jgi:hypothetical protein
VPGNTISSFYQTLINAVSEAVQVLAPTWKVIGSIYHDYKEEAATIGQTLNVVLPADPLSSVADAGVADINLTDISFTTVPIVFNQHPLFSYVVRDFEQFNSPQAIRSAFLDGALKGLKSYVNNALAALFTTAHFTTNTAISTTGGLITTDQFLSGMAVLADQKVPVADDPENMSLLLPSVPYTKVVGNANWTQAQIAGMKTAEFVRETGTMPTAYGMTVKLDQQMPVSGTAGSRTFTGAYLHKWAVALVSRQLPLPDSNVVDFMYLDFNGLPIRLQIGYNLYPKLGYVVVVDAGFGLAVVREKMCQLYTIAE